jgi:hypothetical protein
MSIPCASGMTTATRSTSLPLQDAAGCVLLPPHHATQKVLGLIESYKNPL